METVDFFSTFQPMRGYRGDTFPVFRVDVSGMESTDGCSMRVVLEDKKTPGSIAFVKECFHYTGEGEDYFAVQLDSSETAELCGVYTVHFILTDTSENDYRKLVGTLEVFNSPQEVT